MNKNSDFCFAMLTDTHLCDIGADTAEKIKAQEMDFDCIVHLGGLINGNNPRGVSEQLLEWDIERYRNAVDNKKLFVAQGKSDGYRDERYLGQLALNIMTDEIWYDKTKFIDEYEGVSRPGKKPYYYADFADKKIRLVFLCPYFYQIDEENEIYRKYHDIDTQQLAWLKNSALNVPEGYRVLIFSNTIPNSNYETGKDFSMYKGFAIEPLFAVVQQSQRRGVDVKCWFTGGYDSDEQMTVGGIYFKAIRSHMPQSLCRQLDVKDRGAWYIVTVTGDEIKVHEF